MMFASRLIAALIITGMTVTAQSPDSSLQKAKAQATLADQKAESDVTAALQEAEKLAATSKPKAVERLKQALNALDLSILVGNTKRDELAKSLQSRIASYEGPARETRPALDPNAEKTKAETRAAIEKARIETDDVTKGLRKTAELMEQGRYLDATKAVNALAAKYPNNPAVIALAGKNLTSTNLANWNKLQSEYAQAWVVDQQNLAATATPIAGEIKFPSAEKWKDLTARRREASRLKLSPREEQILKSLGTVVSVMIKDRPFQEGLQEFSNQIKEEIHIDTKSLEDLGLDLNRKTTFNGNVSARTALRALLQPQGLTFVVKDEIIQVVTLEKAEREMLTTRSYDISDIIDTGGPFANAVVWGPQMSYQQMMQNAEAIQSLVKESIDPKCWKDKGGFCSIVFHLPTKSLVVRASTEVHAALGGSITGK
jgi:hypothetical protein